MKRFALLILLLVGLVLAGCSSDAREDPFVGQWESTGGSQISLVVEQPADGEYPVSMSGGNLDRTMTATKVGEGEYRAEPEFVWTFRMVDDDLMNVTIEGGEDTATTSFKRIGG